MLVNKTNYLNSILVDPITKQTLRVHRNGKEFISNISSQFSKDIKDGIPIILPKEMSANPLSSNAEHIRFAHFDYIDHYQKDAQYFDYFLEFENPITKDEIRRLQQKIVSHIPTNIHRILDVGCGNGWLGKAMVSDKTQVVSMDISLVNVRKALENNPHSNHCGLVADVFNLPLAEESIDCIVASEIMEHVINPKLFIKKILHPLKKGGKLIITTPYNEKITKHLCIHCNRPTPENAHIHSFNEQNIRSLIPDGVKGWNYDKLANKYLPKIKFYLLIKSWPFKSWEKIDRIANRIIRHETRLLIEIEK